MKNNFIAESVKYNYLFGSFSKIWSFLFSIILARILFPEDFGILLFANVINGFLTIFSNVGISSYYFQKKINDENEEIEIINTTTFFTLIAFAIVSLLQIICGLFFIFYLNNNIVGKILLLYSLAIIISIPISIRNVICKKHFFYRTLTKSRFYRDLIGSPIKVIFAFLGLGPISVAMGDIFGKLAQWVYLKRNDNILPFSIKHNGEYNKNIVFFGKHGLFISIGGYLNNQIDKIFFTSIYPLAQLGFLSFGSKYAGTPGALLLSPQRDLKKSWYVLLKPNIEDLSKGVFNLNFLISSVLLPIYLFLILEAQVIIPAVFGIKWIDAIPFFQLYIFNSMIFLGFEATNGLLVSLGYPEIISKLTWIRTPIIFISLYIFSRYNVSLFQLCYIYILSNSILYFPYVIISLRKIRLNIFKYYFSLLPILFSIILSAIVYFICKNYIIIEDNFFNFFIYSIMYFGTYILILLIVSGTKIKKGYKFMLNTGY